MGPTTTSQLESYLKSAGIEYAALEELSGGTANFVWRLTLPSGETRVVKHAEPYIKNNPAIPFSVDRVQFEANALSLLPQTLTSTPSTPSTPTVQLPTLHHHDPTTHLLIMTDAGPHNLKSAYPSTPTPSIPPIGTALGTFLAHLHATTTPTRAPFSNPTARAMYRHPYTHLASAYTAHGLDAALAHALDADHGALLATDDHCICHGDFWPGNILVANDETTTTLTVVDWELTRRGSGATDVAQFAAEAYLLDRFCGGKGLLAAFLEAYVRTAKGCGSWVVGEGEEFVRRVVVHFGVHLAFWPTVVGWCGKEETAGLVGEGRGFSVAGREGDWDGVGEGPLEPVLGLLAG